ncbi:MAG: hypothetical protein HY901_09820 [Deltaproteobacteria bacterium]|nr:hypothetical protein [Deltaproteobacteria bacterium]
MKVQSWALGTALLMAVALTGAHAAAAAKEQSIPKLAVLDVKTSGSIDPKTVQGLSVVIAAEAAKQPVRVLSTADLATLLGFDKQRQMLGCTDSSCLAEIGGALGVDYLLVSEVAEVGGIWVLALTVLNVSKAQAVSRQSYRVPTAASLVDVASAGVDQVLSEVLQPGAKRPAAVARTSAGSTRRTVGYVLDGTGAAMLAGGVVFGLLARGSFQDAKAAASADEMSRLKDRTSTQMVVADVLFAAGAVAAGAGLYLTLWAPSPEPGLDSPKASTLAIGLAPRASGGALVFSGALP